MFNKSLLAKIAFAGILLVAALWFSGKHDIGALFSQALGVLRQAGAVTFFLAMAFLPAIGAPLTFFTLTVGSAFGSELGMPLVMLLSLACIAFNMALSYALAHRALRPLLGRLVQKLGYRLPKLDDGTVGDLIILVRVTPGLPFPVQNYMLGLAAAPFGRYLVLSCMVALPLNGAIIVFGEALLQGQSRAALVGLLLVAAVMAVISLLRRRYARKSMVPDPLARERGDRREAD